MHDATETPQPEIVEAIPKYHSRRLYPWEEWNDGQVRKFLAGVHFQSSAKRFAAAARRFAEERGFGVEARIDGQVVWLRFLPEPKRAGQRRQAGL